MGIGRPSSYTPEIGDLICDRLANGESLRTICSGDDMPDRESVRRWLMANESFRGQYALAREAQADTLFDDVLEIADNVQIGETIKTKEDGTVEVVSGDMIQHRRLRVDARKWMAGKLRPKVYGDKVAIGGADDLDPIRTVDMTAIETARRLAFLLASGLEDKG